MSGSKKIGFHEATVVNFYRCGAVVVLKVEGAWVNGCGENVVVEICPVSGVIVDGELWGGCLMEEADGEIVELDFSNDWLSLLVEWNNFALKRSFVRSYKVQGGQVSISVV